MLEQASSTDITVEATATGRRTAPDVLTYRYKLAAAVTRKSPKRMPAGGAVLIADRG